MLILADAARSNFFCLVCFALWLLAVLLRFLLAFVSRVILRPECAVGNYRQPTRLRFTFSYHINLWIVFIFRLVFLLALYLSKSLMNNNKLYTLKFKIASTQFSSFCFIEFSQSVLSDLRTQGDSRDRPVCGPSATWRAKAGGWSTVPHRAVRSLAKNHPKTS